MRFDSKNDLVSYGFSGFKSVTEIRDNKSLVPDKSGVYIVLFPEKVSPEFIYPGSGGFFKGKDPNVTIDILKRNWVDNSPVIYIGKAGGSKSDATLRKRIGQYLAFGSGRDIGHYGGRFIWQLANHEDLIFCWKILEQKEPREVEEELIKDFTNKFGRMPFANLI